MNQATGTGRRALGAAALLFAVWGGVAPFAGQLIGVRLDSAMSARIVDHVVPGLAGLVGALVSLRARRDPVFPLFFMLAGGLWMAGSHLPLIAQARRGDAPWGASAFHFTPGVLLAVVTAVLLVPLLLKPETSP